MAAPIKTCSSILRKWSFSWNRCRYYARKARNKKPEFISPEEDVQKLKGRIRDPRNNAYLPFSPEDPVQSSISLAARKTKENVFSKRSDRKEPGYNMKEQMFKGNNKELSHFKHSNVSKDRHRQQNTIDFEKLEETDKRFGRLITVAKTKTDRASNQEIVLEGKKLITNALEVGAKLKVLYFTKLEKLEELPTDLFGDAKLYKVLFRHLKLWSDVDNPQGLLAIFELPNKVLKPIPDPIPLTLICDSVREGGNLGTLIRTAAAVGCQQVIALKGCVDIWNGKVLRAAAGSHFRIPILSDVTWSQVPAILPPADSINVYLLDVKQVVCENDQEEMASAETFSAMKQIEEVEDYESDIEDAVLETDATSDHDDDDDNDVDDHDIKSAQTIVKALPENIEEDLSYLSFKVLNAYKNAPLNGRLYDKVDYSNKHTVLVVSGETSGSSLPARKLTYDHFGAIVHLPMTDGMENFNCAIAGSVVMFEAAKQYRNNSVPTSEDDE